MGKVYVAKGGELYKFGSSENPEERLKKLQTGSPVKLELVYFFETAHPRRAEATLQKVFADKHEHGEWYRLNEADVLHIKKSTTPVPAAPQKAPQQPVGARTGAVAAVHDIWEYCYDLLIFFVLAVPFFVWLDVRDEPMGYLEPRQTAFAPPPTAQAVQEQPTIPPVAVQPPPPLIGNAQPVQSEPQPLVDQVLPELIPINDATAAALGAFIPQAPPPAPAAAPAADAGSAPVVPTPEGWAVQWPEPPNNPQALAEFAQEAQETLREAGYEFSDKPFEISQHWVGP